MLERKIGEFCLSSLKNQSVISEKCIVMERFFDRFLGLMGRRVFPRGSDGLFFPQCNNLHVYFMRMPIDVVFVRESPMDSNGTFEVMSILENVQPWRLLPLMDFKSQHAFEFPQGTVARRGIQIGDLLCTS